MGLGTQDSLEMAEDFVAEHEMESLPMLWDPGFDSWTYYGITGQPSAVLVHPGGEPIAGWSGGFPPEKVLELVANS